MKTKLFLICACVLIALVACAAPPPTATPVPPPDLGATIKSLANAMNDGNLDGAIAFYADDAIRTQQPPPAGQSGTWTGKEQIRGSVKSLLDDHFNVEISNLQVVGNKVTYTCAFSTDTYKKMGIAPLVVTEEAVFDKGKIKSQAVTITPETLAKIQAAMAAAQAKAEIPATKNEDVFGVWLVTYSPSDRVVPSAENHWEHTADGNRIATVTSGAMKGYTTTAKYWFEGGLYKIQYPQGGVEANSNAIGTYQVYVTKQGGKAVQLRFVVVDDLYIARVDRMTYKVWTRVDR